jgi:hypothetical protein
MTKGTPPIENTSSIFFCGFSTNIKVIAITRTHQPDQYRKRLSKKECPYDC